MPKYICLCGNFIDHSEIPSSNQWFLIWDMELKLLGKSIDLDELYRAMRTVFKCEKCQRMWIFHDDLNQGISYTHEQLDITRWESFSELKIHKIKSKSCLCGFTIPLYKDPNPLVSLIISDIELNRIPQQIDYEEIMKHFGIALHCPFCNRIWVYEKDNMVVAYLNEGYFTRDNATAIQ